MAILVAFAAVLAFGAARLGFTAAELARARTAADASALAGALEGRGGAELLAQRNGGSVVSFRRVGTDVLVTVQVGRSRASARARPVFDVVDGVTVHGGAALPVPPNVVGPIGAWRRPHHDYPAADLPVPTGTPVGALAAGRVRWTDDSQCGIGISVEVEPGVRYVYCHGSARTVADGALVRPGQQVMRSGSTGHATGPHLHVGIFVDGRSVCPQPILTALVAGRPPAPWRALPTSGCTS